MTSQQNIKSAAIFGVIYKLFERMGVQIIGLVVSIILARLVDPDIIGAVSLAEVFVLLFTVIATYGFGNSLIQKKDMTESDISTALIASLALAAILYLIIFISAPYVEIYYGYSDYHFTEVIRVLGISMFFTSIKSIQQALIAKRMIFKFFFYSSLISIVFSGGFGIVFAYMGYGIWAIVIQYLTCEIVGMAALAYLLKWKPSMVFSISSLREILDFGWKMIFIGIFNVFYTQLRSLVIAKKYSASDLAFFNRGFRFAKLIPENLGEALMAVLFPVFANYTEQKGLINWMRKSIKITAFVIFPLIIGLFAVSENVIIVLLTEKWIPAIFYLRIFCLSYLFYSIEQIIDQSIKAIGKSGILLGLNLTKNGIGIFSLCITYKRGVMAIAVGLLISMMINYLMSMLIARQLFAYGLCRQIWDIGPAFFVALVMGAVCIGIDFLNLNVLIKLILQIFIGGIVYIGLAKLFRLEMYGYILATIKVYIRKDGEEKYG